jgi:hypothetical protein
MGNTSQWPRLTHYSPELNEYFVDYSAFEYSRTDTFPGCVVYLNPETWASGYQAAHLLDVVQFSPETPKQTNVAGFAQMAEDARAVIYFVHTYDAVIAYIDPVGVSSWDACVLLAAELNGSD